LLFVMVCGQTTPLRESFDHHDDLIMFQLRFS